MLFFKKKVNLTHLSEILSEDIAKGTIRTILESMKTGGEEESDDVFDAHFFGQLMAWSITSNSMGNEDSRQISHAITDQLPYRYAELGVFEDCSEESIRDSAASYMQEVVQKAKSGSFSDVSTALGFWVSRASKETDPMRVMSLPLEYIECISANARLIESFRKKFKVIYDIKY